MVFWMLACPTQSSWSELHDIVDIRALFVHAITADPLHLMLAMKDLRAALKATRKV